jgi:hemerythrin-like domain-containing protein
MIDYAHAERRILDGEVDFSMMYFAHDAFTRHLHRLAVALDLDEAPTAGTLTRWAMFNHQLRLHHTTEDTSLWPPLRAAVTVADELAVLDAMEREHAQLDPQLDAVETALCSRHGRTAAARVRDLTAGLGAHMRHEENEAPPLVESYLGRAGWAAFGRAIRKTQGLRGAAVYFPWLLDGAPDATSAQVLSLVPPPVRFLYRRVWAPRYRRSMS